MLDIKRIRENADEVRRGQEARGADTGVVDQVLALDEQRRGLLTQVEQLKGDRNKASKEIGSLKKAGEDTAEMQARVREVGEQIAAQVRLLRR